MDELTPERRYAESAGVILTGLGMPPSSGKLLGWLLICDPPEQTSGQLAQALDLSKASVSTGMRMLESAGLVRRAPAPGHRGHAYRMLPDAFIRIAADGAKFRTFRELMERGLDLLDQPESSRAQRLRNTRDFYAFFERELPGLVERFRTEHLGKGDADG